MKILPKIARLIFANGLILVIYNATTPGNNIVISFVSGILVGVGAALDWGEDDN